MVVTCIDASTGLNVTPASFRLLFVVEFVVVGCACCRGGWIIFDLSHLHQHGQPVAVAVVAFVRAGAVLDNE